MNLNQYTLVWVLAWLYHFCMLSFLSQLRNLSNLGKYKHKHIITYRYVKFFCFENILILEAKTEALQPSLEDINETLSHFHNPFYLLQHIRSSTVSQFLFCSFSTSLIDQSRPVSTSFWSTTWCSTSWRVSSFRWLLSDGPTPSCLSCSAPLLYHKNQIKIYFMCGDQRSGPGSWCPGQSASTPGVITK